MAAAAVSTVTQPSIPLDLSRFLPDQETPWNISQKLFERMQKQEYSAGKTFKTCEVLKEDPEFRFVFRYFFDHKPPGLSIRKIVCIHNPHQTRAFEGMLPGMEKAAQAFRPTWDNEEPKALRAKATQRWEEQTRLFSPFTVQVGDKRKDRYIHVKVLPLWHGTKHVDSICSIGFTFFGKHHMLQPAAGAGPGPGAQKSTDVGYFGSGIYFTNSARYAAMYNKGTLLLSWVAMRRPYPIVSDVPLPQKCSDMAKLEGQGAYQNSNAHYIPVTPIDPSDPECMECHPCAEGVEPVYDEYVVFQSTQALPRFCIELGVDLPATPAASAKNALHIAAEAGNIDAVRQLSTRMELLNAKDENGNSPLLLAALKGHLKVCEMLLKAGANPLAVNNDGESALHLAAENGKIEVVRTFLTYKKLIETKDSKGFTPLLTAARAGHREIFEILLKAGANPLAVSSGNYSALYIAAANKHLTIVQSLVIYKGLLETKCKDGATPLIIAAHLGHRKVCKVLLQAGANRFAVENHGSNALHVATQVGKIKVIQTLVMYKDLLEVRNNVGFTPLHSAAHNGHREVCEDLLKAGANSLAVTKNGRSALHVAACQGKTNVVPIFLVYKDLIDLACKFGFTPLLAAAESGHREICEMLLITGANPLAVNNDGESTLHLAARAGKTEVVQLLLVHKELLEIRDKRGYTPLLAAAQFGYREVCEMLLKAGANPLAVDSNGDNALWLAVLNGKLDVVHSLVADKNLLEARDIDGNTSLLNAAHKGHREVCEILLKAGANALAVSNDGCSALYLAALAGKTDVVQDLVVHKDLLEVANKNGFTPLLAAAFFGHRESCEVLLKAGANHLAVNNGDCSALYFAVEQGKTDVVQALLVYKDLLEIKDKKGFTPLLTAALKGYREICEMLLKAGADLLVCTDGCSALYIAANKGKTDVVQALLVYKDLLEVRQKHDFTPLLTAAQHGHREICEMLLKAGANFLAVTNGGRSALCLAAEEGKLDIVQILHVYKGLLEVADKHGYTPLLAAANKGHREVCEVLLKAGANPLAVTNSGRSALYLAALRGHTEIIKIFIVYKELLESREQGGATPLHGAAYYGHLKVCEVLLKAGANPLAVTNDGSSALYTAAQQGKSDVVHTLLVYRDLLETTNKNGNTPLLAAAESGHREVCEMLLKAGANPLAVTTDGASALHLAAQKGNIEVVQVLGVYKVLLETRDKEGFTPLLRASFNGHRGMCEGLLKAGANALAVNKNKESALHLAARAGKTEVVQVFVVYKELLETRDKDSFTPLLAAAYFGHQEVCELLLKAEANPFAVTFLTENALHLAAKRGHKDVYQAFLSHQSLLSQRDINGLTPMLLPG